MDCETIRGDIHRRFSGLERLVESTFREEPRGENAFQYALELYIRTIPEMGSVDGWEVLHIVKETSDSLQVIGLMHVLPASRLPIEANFYLENREVRFSILVGEEDELWLKMSDSQKKRAVHSYVMSTAPSNWHWMEPISGKMQRSL